VLENYLDEYITPRYPPTTTMAPVPDRGRQDSRAHRECNVAAGRLPHDSASRARLARVRIGNHTFRATGITAYFKNNGRLESAQQSANYEDTSPTKLYGRRADEISLDGVEKFRPRVHAVAQGSHYRDTP
jgi:hypothetical protein